MSKVQPWFERKFSCTFPVEQFPNLCVRLQGTPARLEEMLRGIPSEVLLRKPDDKWSAQEHAGHMLDLEPLWLARVNDFLAEGETLTVADLSNRKTHEAGHNARDLADILSAFRAARLPLLTRLQKVQASVFSRTRLHPRLKQHMRLVDHLYFVAEHDDHHLATIWAMIEMR
jgi:uncharacterized damage-inducible protein DinB